MSTNTYGMKISPSITHLQEYFHMFFSVLKDIIQPQIKKNHWIS